MYSSWLSGPSRMCQASEDKRKCACCCEHWAPPWLILYDIEWARGKVMSDVTALSSLLIYLLRESFEGRYGRKLPTKITVKTNITGPASDSEGSWVTTEDGLAESHGPIGWSHTLTAFAALHFRRAGPQGRNASRANHIWELILLFLLLQKPQRGGVRKRDLYIVSNVYIWYCSTLLYPSVPCIVSLLRHSQWIPPSPPSTSD